jgi:hypothetical protein
MPLGFASLAAAGLLLVAAGAVYEHVHVQKSGARRVKSKTRLHKKKLHYRPREFR